MQSKQRHISIKHWISLLLLCCTTTLFAQNQAPTGSGNSLVKVLHADLLNVEQRKESSWQRLRGNVELRNENMFMYCDSALIENETQVYAYGNVVIQQGDSLQIFSNEAQYDAESKIANLIGNVLLINGKKRLYTRRLDYRSDTKVAYFTTGATMLSDSTQLRSKVGYYYVDTKEALFREEVTVVDPQFKLKADSLNYNTDNKVVRFLGPTVITTDSSKVYCESGFYDTNNQKARFTQDPQYIKAEQEAEADTIDYDGKLKIYTLYGNARVEDSTRLALGELIRYDELQDTTFLQGNARYKEGKQDIEAPQISYNRKTGTFSTTGRGTFVDGGQILKADRVRAVDSTGLALANGDVFWQDTSAKLAINSQFAEYNKKTEYIKAIGGKMGRPELITEVEGDSLFLAADTLVAIKADTSKLDSSRLLRAYHGAKIFKKDFQAVSDSLIYSTRDSMFILYGNPIVWSDTSQFTADTIYILLKNKKINQIWLRSNSFQIVVSDGRFFNQIKARNTIAYFTDSDLRRMDAFGNAEVVYYAKDDGGAYVGVNKTVCSELVIRFGEGNSLEKITFITEPKSVLSPMGKVDHKTLLLPGFRWEIEKRPTERADIFKVDAEKVKVVPAKSPAADLKK
jgi:lipopolysaccharide export system protein LptA